MTKRFVNFLLAAMLTVSAPILLQAQMTAVTDQTSTPIPGVGHGYIEGLEETVNPANGSVSLRLKVPMQPGRGLSVPFSFAYDSNGAYFLTGGQPGHATWTSNKSGIASSGWSYSLPVLSFNTGTTLVEGQYTCAYKNGYVFQDPQGTRHQFRILEYEPGAHCPTSENTANIYEGAYQADATFDTAQINDPDGTVYTFVQGAGCSSYLPTQIEDRNGNVVTFSGACQSGTPGAFTMGDTLGNTQTRTALSSSGFGTTGNTISVSGLTNPYTVTWGTVTSNFTVDWTPELVSPNCVNDPIPPESGTDPVITKISLPDNTSSYTLEYNDPVSGLLTGITYPSRATVTYTWALNGLGPNSNTSSGTFSDGSGGTCSYRYDTYALQHRYVSFDGTTPALQQDFSYQTSWQSSTSTGWETKTTTVTTHDLLAGRTYTTVYSYTSIDQLTPPLVSGAFATQIPVESSISYQDSGGPLLEVVNEHWNDLYTLSSKSTTLYDPLTQVNATSQTNYSYTSLRDQLLEQDDYDFGNATTPVRKTTWQYQGFAAVPIYPVPSTIVDRPCKVIVQDGSGNPYAETDYLYDNQTAACGAAGTPAVSPASTPTGTHDEPNYSSSSSAPRGNATSVTRKCLSGCTTDATTTYTYDEAGQVLSMTDPCYTAGCSDMLLSGQNNHTTYYSYTDSSDSPSDGNSAGNSDAYATTITHPNTGVAHVDYYEYNYTSGELTQATDENGKATKYGYTDPFLRLTDTYAPASAQNNGAVPHTHVSYVDTYPPSVTTTNPLGIVSQAVYDGMGHQTHTHLTSQSPNENVDMTYNGMGLLASTTNPYRSGDTIATTSYIYDALGRKTTQTQPDTSTQQWTYSVNAVTFQDEGGNQWQRTSNALGWLTKVLEPSSTSQAPTLEADYTYDPLGNLLTVNQLGTATEVPRPRSFSYDSLSRLVCASNPETETTYVACPATTTGTLSYSYDANSNVTSRTYGGGITTTYSNYDGLGRVGLKSYSDVITPSVSYAYDTSALHATGNVNLSGRLAQVTTLEGGSVLYNYSSVGYDELGRATGYTECSGASDCTTASHYQQVGYVYDLVGNTTRVTSASSYGGVMEASQRNFIYSNASYSGASNLSSVTSAVQGAAATTLFTSPTYNASGMLTGASLAVDPLLEQPSMGVTRGYDSRLRPISETDTQLPPVSTSATVTVNVSGTEQSTGGSGTASPATGTIVFSYSGAQVMRATPLFVGSSITLPDGYRTSFVAPSNSAVGVANALAAVLNTASSPVTAVVAAGGTTTSASITLTTNATGADQNGAIKLTLVSQVTAAPASLSGGGGPTYDTGTVTVSVNGNNLATTYGQTSTALTVAQGLASAINAANVGFDAMAASPGSLTVTASQPGPADNGLPLSISSVTDEPSLFASPSFTGGSGTFSGGSDSTIYSYTIPSPGTSTTGYTANGNLLSYADSMNGTAEAWNFTANSKACYDPLNRVTCANATSGPWGPVNGQSGLSLSWTYDSFGNRTLQGVSGSPSEPAPQPESAQFATNNNHVTFATTAPSGFQYDNAGDVTNDGINAYAYDGEGRLCALIHGSGANRVMMGYAYDGLGNRVAKGTINSFSCNMSPSNGNGFTATTNFIVGQNGEQLDELDLQGNPQHSNVYANGQLLATYVYSQSDWIYAFNDWLGTKRVTTNAARTTTETCLSLPFGDALNCSGGIDPSEHHFTGKERDQESGNDYFGARYYASAMGRFMSPDSDTLPDDVPYADFNNPQSLNLYSYVRNNPLSQTDADGHDVNVCTAGSDGSQQCSLLTNDQYQAAQQAGNGGLNVPSLNSVGTNGSGSITDANGNTVGSATYVSNGGADYYGNQAGYNMLGAASRTVNYATAGAAAVYGAAFLGPAASGMGSGLITLGISSGPALFAAGQLFEHTFETSAGEVGFLAEVESAGSTLILKDVAVYPTGTSGSLNVGTGQVMQALHQLENLAKSQGFTQLQITGQRLSGANPGGLVNITRNLK
jgi:RHS repeat-associated protein